MLRGVLARPELTSKAGAVDEGKSSSGPSDLRLFVLYEGVLQFGQYNQLFCQ